jgi:DNA-binding Lrp family transcriptional regulator
MPAPPPESEPAIVTAMVIMNWPFSLALQAMGARHALQGPVCRAALLRGAPQTCQKRGNNVPPGAARMIPFFVQIKCKLGKAYEVANALADSEIASEIYSTAGEFDLLAKFYVDEGTDIGHFVNEKVQVVPGIQDTRTIITFKAFG